MWVQMYVPATQNKTIIMDLNITLKLDEDLIEKLKAYAQEKNMSISLLLESYANK
ncbi:DUF6364 family protein [Penaeicola halotolerans]|uniref:DUF6364 family protein n=1 Tax=Penaeicola halotolerans TaxID=2793196 RepID=UPI001CF91347|nr:DUF6364 family protein [Penaeicola halotolerans]